MTASPISTASSGCATAEGLTPLTASQLSDLADTISHWMIYKQLSGFERFLSESMLLMPLAEYFVGHGWAVATEQDLHKMTQTGRPGVVNYDLVAAERAHGGNLPRSQTRILVEVKFLTKRGYNHARIHSDFTKLAIAEGQFQRLAVMALDKGASFPSPFTQWKDAIRFSYGLNDAPQYHVISDSDVRRSIATKLEAYNHRELTCKVTRVAKRENVLIFSVNRIEAP